MNYDFNFDEMTIGDFVTVQKAAANSKNPSSMVEFIEIIPKFTNTDIQALPFAELQNVIKQFIAALAFHVNGGDR